MRSSRLTLALDGGVFELPDTGRIAVFDPAADTDLSALPAERVQIIQGFKPDFDAWAGRGYDVDVAPYGAYSAAVVFTPRAKDRAHAYVAQAVAHVGGGPIVIDGQKTDGIDSLLKACRARGDVGASYSKAHGKVFVLQGQDAAFADWKAAVRRVDDQFETLPGVFSADGVDRGSALLAQALPAKLKGRVADLGAGWGYLAAQVLLHQNVAELHLVEADQAALGCAKRNVQDARTQFHWADATCWVPPGPCDFVVTNPPFHAGRTADPAIGQAFLRNGARMLTNSGTLLCVANRHLPYERILAELFVEVDEIGGDNGFKVLRAVRPIPKPRGRR